jgi:hypothetical protein
MRRGAIDGTFELLGAPKSITVSRCTSAMYVRKHRRRRATDFTVIGPAVNLTSRIESMQGSPTLALTRGICARERRAGELWANSRSKELELGSRSMA